MEPGSKGKKTNCKTHYLSMHIDIKTAEHACYRKSHKQNFIIADVSELTNEQIEYPVSKLMSL